MTATAFIRGHPVFWDNDARSWRYVFLAEWINRNGGVEFEAQIVTMTERPRPCTLCEMTIDTWDSPDPCIGMLPGVVSACCGHGVERCYVMWEGGVRTVGDVLRERPN